MGWKKKFFQKNFFSMFVDQGSDVSMFVDQGSDVVPEKELCIVTVPGGIVAFIWRDPAGNIS